MIYPENRYPLFEIMLAAAASVCAAPRFATRRCHNGDGATTNLRCFHGSLAQELAQQSDGPFGVLENRGVARAGQPFEPRALDVPGEPARRVEEARDVVVAADDERRRHDPLRLAAQVGGGERLAGERIALPRGALQPLSH